MVKKPNIYFALPVMDESTNLPSLLACLANQSFKEFKLIVCVNQYESYWNDEKYSSICLDNEKSLKLLVSYCDFEIVVIDKSSKGNGWPRKKGGVGWARKTIMDEIVNIGDQDDIMISIDADTHYPSDYAEKIREYFTGNQQNYGLAIPYYHNLYNDETDHLILRYEIYMRYYLLNMMRIKNPYGFTALGSAMAFPVWAYVKVGGLTPVVSGEDFYFLQKLNKSGPLGLWVDTIAYPSPRFSSRVVFGTGPALIKGKDGDWDSYPIYNYLFFNEVGETFQLFDELYTKDIETPMDEFFSEQFGTRNWYDSLRKNYRDKDNFIRACFAKTDGLRILQYLRYRSKNENITDERNLFVYLNQILFREMGEGQLGLPEQTEYEKCSVGTLTKVRDKLFEIEMRERKNRLLTYHINYA